MASWIVGDIHGCAQELSSLIERLGLGADDRLISCGDLFHRGPDPAGVMDLLREAQAEFILGNHERAVLRRVGLAPAKPDASDRAPVRMSFPPIDAEDLAGDGGLVCHIPSARREEFLVYLQSHSGYYLRGSELEGAGLTIDGRDWCVVHAGLDGSLPLEENLPHDLTRMRRLPRRGQPWWYEVYGGPALVMFGHTASKIPRAHRQRGKLIALGLDTGCVYGGTLCAYSPELDEFVQVKAAAAYAA